MAISSEPRMAASSMIGDSDGRFKRLAEVALALSDSDSRRLSEAWIVASSWVGWSWRLQVTDR